MFELYCYLKKIIIIEIGSFILKKKGQESTVFR